MNSFIIYVSQVKKILHFLSWTHSLSIFQVKKILQFYEATQQRMGVVVVGPSGCGKSTVWRVLKAALARLGHKIPTYVMNPKSMPREQLLGHMDMDTREWFDGVLTSSARKVAH